MKCSKVRAGVSKQAPLSSSSSADCSSGQWTLGRRQLGLPPSLHLHFFASLSVFVFVFVFLFFVYSRQLGQLARPSLPPFLPPSFLSASVFLHLRLCLCCVCVYVCVCACVCVFILKCNVPLPSYFSFLCASIVVCIFVSVFLVFVFFCVCVRICIWNTAGSELLGAAS